ncbi:DUF3857 domain-containing protein [Xylella taiwanensis]|uniref:Transglutaminase n=2 Tax=Xylella taiwanensis TaxID=1444770 RepID=Z9JGB2_9GAMM|nr:transglutaminase [Xylella taiwanensis]EWS77435.1 transglutaminase [Xylella taiwanensis]NBI36195.1 DUF3857 domain-containing protein [Xylella taiwanensis]QKD98830.1 DUF3857 and transglutaminase domain-containing protein [Xylella taiwanensis]
MMRLLFVFLLSLMCTVTVAYARNVPPAAQTDGNFSYLRYRADYEVRADAGSVETNDYDIRLNTQAAVEQFSQVRLGYSEKMQKLEILEAYTITAAGIRQDVAAAKIYTQESYSSASAAMYADYKVKVVVFPNLAPGAHVVYRVRRTQLTPYFPDYFGFWETFSVFTRYDDAVVTLRAPRKLPMHVWVRGVHGSTRPRLQGDQARWEWRYRRNVPLQSQTWSAALWEFSPTVMVSTFKDWSQLGHAYDVKAGKAAAVTPRVRALADQITAGIPERRAQAAALYNWVARNIRYVAVYLGNGGLEPNRANVILEQHYGDCKDHAVILEALLAAKGIQSTPVLIGADGGPTLPPIAVLGRFNHAITYVPEFKLYLDSTNPYARFGQLPASDLGVPVVHTADGHVTRTPPHDVWANTYVVRTEYRFAQDGSLNGETMLDLGPDGEIATRAMFVELNAQNRRRIEENILAQSGFDGDGMLELLGMSQDLQSPFSYRYRFWARDYIDFSMAGGLALPYMPGADSMRNIYTNTPAETNLTPFYCNESLHEETYVLRFPADVPIIAIPGSHRFRNRAGEYNVEWHRDGQTITAMHRLRHVALHGPEKLCLPGDYQAFRQLYQQVRRGFREQVLYGDLRRVQTAAH